MHAIAERRITAPATAWHGCLEFFSVATRLPPEFRLSAADAARLLDREVFTRIAVHDLPANERAALMRVAAHDQVIGGRIHDAHIAETLRISGAYVVVTDNRRHFMSALRYRLRVETPAEFVDGLRTKKR